jgi:ferredoxin-2, mitochondrial
MEEPTDEENDMLDLAPGLTETSRLGCQVIMCKDFDGMVVTLPNATRNVQSERFAERQHSSPAQQQQQSQVQSQQ